MIDLGISKLALIGVVALIVVGPEKLPRVARMAGAFLGKAQRYVADVKAEVNRSMELEELKKMKDSMESAARDVEQSVQAQTAEFEKSWKDPLEVVRENAGTQSDFDAAALEIYPEYKRPNKNWRLKQGATPQWYKARNGVRTRALSGAARVARYRPRAGAGTP